MSTKIKSSSYSVQDRTSLKGVKKHLRRKRRKRGKREWIRSRRRCKVWPQRLRGPRCRYKYRWNTRNAKNQNTNTNINRRCKGRCICFLPKSEEIRNTEIYKYWPQRLKRSREIDYWCSTCLMLSEINMECLAYIWKGVKSWSATSQSFAPISIFQPDFLCRQGKVFFQTP